MVGTSGGRAPATTGDTPADVLERLLFERFSCRGFLPDPVPEEALTRMFAMAQRTASWCNSQAWQVHLVTGQLTARFAAGLADWAASNAKSPDIPGPSAYEGVYLSRRRATGYALYDAVGIERGDTEKRASQARENLRFFGAPHVAVLSSPRALGTYGVADCGGYVATLLLVAQSLGVSSIAQASIAMYSDFVHEFLDIPNDRLIVCAVAFGFEDPHHPANSFRTDRAEIADVVSWLSEPR